VGALVREAQTKALKVPNTGMVVTTDLVDDIKDIHPKNKKDVGLRLANLALEDHYHLGLLSAKSPLYKSMQVNKDKVIISFDNLYTSLQVQGKSVTELFIAGPDKIFRPAKGKIKEGQLIVYNKEVKYPVAVRYSFGNESIGNLYSKEGLPVAPFRTDDW
jgi:sialate O-acetylesterase